MVYEHRHRIRLYEIGSYLSDYIDEFATEPFNGTVHSSLESHARFLLMSDYEHASQLKRRLTKLMTPEHVEHITDMIHDMLLVELRSFLSLDEGESVVDVFVQHNYDTEVIVEELDGAHLALI